MFRFQTQSKALEEIYKIYMLLHNSDLNFQQKIVKSFVEKFQKLQS